MFANTRQELQQAIQMAPSEADTDKLYKKVLHTNMYKNKVYHNVYETMCINSVYKQKMLTVVNQYVQKHNTKPHFVIVKWPGLSCVKKTRCIKFQRCITKCV